MKIKKHAPKDTIHVEYKKGTIDSNRVEGIRIWQKEEDKIYVTCPQCSSISDISDHQFMEDGEISPCVVCGNCRSHYFPQLLDWDGSYSIVCSVCEKSKVVDHGKKAPGWKKVPSGCRCCKTFVCPKCVKEGKNDDQGE